MILWFKRKLADRQIAYWQSIIDDLHHEKSTHKDRMALATAEATKARANSLRLMGGMQVPNHVPEVIRNRPDGVQRFCLVEDRPPRLEHLKKRRNA